MLVTCGPPSILDSAGRCRVHSASAWHNNEGRGCSNSTLEGLWRVSSHFRTCTVRPLSLCWRRHIRVPGEFVQQPTPRLQKLLNLPLTTTAYYRRTWLSLSKMVSLPAATLFLSRLIQQLAATNQTHSKNKAYPRNSPAHLFTMVLVCSFLKMVASGPDAHVINFSDRFTLTDMAGAFSSNLEMALVCLAKAMGNRNCVEGKLLELILSHTNCRPGLQDMRLWLKSLGRQFQRISRQLPNSRLAHTRLLLHTFLHLQFRLPCRLL